MFVLVDTGTHYLNIYINHWYTAQRDKTLRQEKKKALKSARDTAIKRKVTSFKSKLRFNLK